MTTTTAPRTPGYVIQPTITGEMVSCLVHGPYESWVLQEFPGLGLNVTWRYLRRADPAHQG